MKSKLQVAVLAGGASAEAAVSRVSAAAVCMALQSGGHGVEILELDDSLPSRLWDARPQVVFPVTHGALGEDGCVQGLLEVLGYPYVGSDVLGSAIASDKPRAKLLYRAAGLPTAPDATISERVPSVAQLRELRAAIGPDLVVKPASGGSAIGVTRIPANAPLVSLEQALRSVLAADPAVLVERWLKGRDVTCGVLELAQSEPVALPPTLIEPNLADFYDFRSKYAPGGSAHTCPAPFAGELTARIQSSALAAHRALGARDLSRTDFIVGEDGEVSLLETNTLPGMTATSLFPEAARALGIEFPSLCDSLVRCALARTPRRARAVMAMPE